MQENGWTAKELIDWSSKWRYTSGEAAQRVTALGKLCETLISENAELRIGRGHISKVK